MNIYNVKVRLNLEKAEHKAAYKILKDSEKSMSQFIISAVNAYGGYLSKEKEKEMLLQQIKDTVRSTLSEMLGVSIIHNASVTEIAKAEETNVDISDESGEIADDFLQNF